MAIPWLSSSSLAFPDPDIALKEPNGLLAAGGDLRPERLIEAYRQGIFPWYDEFLSDGSRSPILWWCPNPRCVLFVDELKISRSLKKSLRNKAFTLSCNLDFPAVIRCCAEERANSQGTWINEDIIKAYIRLHKLGTAHSVECWQDDRLIGGLYGVSLGKMFYGESMFSRESDASKAALVYLCHIMKTQNAGLIDCQISNEHLLSLGAREIPIARFQELIDFYNEQENLHFPTTKTYASQL